MPTSGKRPTGGRVGECYVVVNARLRGEQFEEVSGVAGAAARAGETHIAVRLGRVVFYLEDRAALASLRRAVGRADAIADRVFGPVVDEITRAERRDRAEFEKSTDRP